MGFKWILKILNPIWRPEASHRQLILAYYFYPIYNKDITNKLFAGILFYGSMTVIAINYISHGYVFNLLDDPPFVAKFFGYHPKLPFLFKLGKFIVSNAMSEIFIFRFYMIYLYFRRINKLENLLNLETYSDKKFRSKLWFWTQFFCLSNSFLGSILVFSFFTYGMENTDDLGKLIAIALTIVSWPPARYCACDLYLVYSYFILLIHMILKFSSQVVAFSRDCLFADPRLTSQLDINSLRIKYYLIVKMIKETSEQISILILTGKLLVIPIMTLAWVIFFEEPGSLFLWLFKWFLFFCSIYYSSRVYFIMAYLSIVHSKSKKLYVNLHSIIARGKVNLDGKRTLLFILENISGRLSKMAFHDSNGAIMEQIDVLKSISVTLELLLLGFTFKNNI